MVIEHLSKRSPDGVPRWSCAVCRLRELDEAPVQTCSSDAPKLTRLYFTDGSSVHLSPANMTTPDKCVRPLRLRGAPIEPEWWFGSSSSGCPPPVSARSASENHHQTSVSTNAKRARHAHHDETSREDIVRKSSSAKRKRKKRGRLNESGTRERKRERRNGAMLPLHTPITFVQENPKRCGSKSSERYEKYKVAKTLGEFFELGGSVADMRHDTKKGFLSFSVFDPKIGEEDDLTKIVQETLNTIVADVIREVTIDRGECSNVRRTKPSNRHVDLVYFREQTNKEVTTCDARVVALAAARS